jgi:serine/threonine-protein kinase RsbW
MALQNDREGSPVFFSLEMPNRLGELESLHLFFERVGLEAGWSDRLCMNMTLACEELLTNTISYGFPQGGDHLLRISVRCSDRQIEVVLEDEGVPFDPLAAGEPDLELSLDDRPIGGLGIHFAKRLMDEMAYERTPSGNRLVLLKKV